MKQQPETFTFPDPKFRYSKRAHFLHLIILGLSILSISTVAIFYSLGYQLNFQARTIQQTGLIILDSRLNQKDVVITVNDEDRSTEFPYRSSPLFPGTYTISITKNGFQPWTRTVDVLANKVTSFKAIILIKSAPKSVASGESDQATLATAHEDNDGIQIRGGNELWIKGNFITRTSGDISAVRWFPDRNHVAYQTGSSILLAELDGRHTQTLVTLPNAHMAAFTFINNGQNIIYETDGNYYTANLY